jgi:hypothetical protein
MSADSDPPDSDDFGHEEKTDHGVEDVPKPMRTWARSQSRRMRTVEKQFEKGGMVRDLHEDWNAVKKGVGFFKWFAPMVAAAVIAAITGIIYLVNHAASQPVPQPSPRAEDIAREVVKAQQK